MGEIKSTEEAGRVQPPGIGPTAQPSQPRTVRTAFSSMYRGEVSGFASETLDPTKYKVQTYTPPENYASLSLQSLKTEITKLKIVLKIARQRSPENSAKAKQIESDISALEARIKVLNQLSAFREAFETVRSNRLNYKSPKEIATILQTVAGFMSNSEFETLREDCTFVLNGLGSLSKEKSTEVLKLIYKKDNIFSFINKMLEIEKESGAIHDFIKTGIRGLLNEGSSEAILPLDKFLTYDQTSKFFILTDKEITTYIENPHPDLYKLCEKVLALSQLTISQSQIDKLKEKFVKEVLPLPVPKSLERAYERAQVAITQLSERQGKKGPIIQALYGGHRMKEEMGKLAYILSKMNVLKIFHVKKATHACAAILEHLEKVDISQEKDLLKEEVKRLAEDKNFLDALSSSQQLHDRFVILKTKSESTQESQKSLTKSLDKLEIDPSMRVMRCEDGNYQAILKDTKFSQTSERQTLISILVELEQMPSTTALKYLDILDSHKQSHTALLKDKEINKRFLQLMKTSLADVFEKLEKSTPETATEILLELQKDQDILKKHQAFWPQSADLSSIQQKCMATLQQKARESAGTFPEMQPDMKIDVKRTVEDIKGQLRTLPPDELRAYYQSKDVQHKLKILKEIGDNSYTEQAVATCGRDSLNRGLLRSKKVAALLSDSKVILALFALEVAQEKNIDPKLCQELNVFKDVGVKGSVAGVVEYGLQQHPVILSSLQLHERPTSEFDYLSSYIVAKKATALPSIFSALGEAYKSLKGRDKILPESQSLFSIPYEPNNWKKYQNFYTLMVFKIKEKKSAPSQFLRCAAGTTPQSLLDQAESGFRLFLDKKMVSSPEEIVNHVATSTKWLSQDASHFLDRLHIAAAILLFETGKKIQEKTVEEYLTSLVMKFATTPNLEHSEIAKEQVWMKILHIADSLLTPEEKNELLAILKGPQPGGASTLQQ